ncbi:MAG: hypothetical protein WC371_03995, partial [Parachlamydiales bacterium]
AVYQQIQRDIDLLSEKLRIQEATQKNNDHKIVELRGIITNLSQNKIPLLKRALIVSSVAIVCFVLYKLCNQGKLYG